MPPQTLREYQQAGVSQIFDAWKAGARSVLAVAPTGSGKTSIFSWIASQIAGHKKRTVLLVHRRELATQAANRFHEFGIEFGFVMAGERPKPYAPIQIASVQTLIRRRKPTAELVICDEAHLSTAKTWATILDSYPNARILGVTATPWRLGGKPLAGAYDACVVIARPAQLRDLGFLCPYVGFSYKTPDLSAVHTVGGEYNEHEAAEAMSQSLIVDSIVEEWGQHARDLSTVVFAVTVEHSKQLTTRFKAAGVAAEHLDGSTSIEQRKAILARVESGQTRVLCNVGVAVEGLDIPRLKCCVLARPTMSLARAIQMMGRVRRPWQGVTARIHDHAFVVKLHGLPDDDRDYRLNAKPEKPPSLTECEVCRAVYTGSNCPNCEHVNEARPTVERVIKTVKEAEKIEFASGQEAPDLPERPPVVIKWTDPGKVIEGIFVRQWEEPSDYGPRKAYLVRGDKRNYQFHGTTQLNRQMAKVKPEQRIRVTYEGERSTGGERMRKEFAVEVDDEYTQTIRNYLVGVS